MTYHQGTQPDQDTSMSPAPSGQAGTSGRRRSGRFAWAAEYPAVTFILLAFGISWLVWIPFLASGSDAQLPLFLGVFGPAIGAALMVRLQGGTVRGWLRSILLFRIKPRWYAAALMLPLVDPAIQALLAWQAGIALSPAALVERMPLYISAFVFILLVGGGQEEFGWRGWLLPQLQRHARPLVASLLIGVVHAAWHLPLFVFGALTYGDTVFALYVPLVVAWSVVFTWLFNSGRASVVLAMVFHAQLNAASALVPVTDLAQFEDAVAAGTVNTTTLQVILTAASVIFAVLLVWRDRHLGLRADTPDR